MNQQMENKNKNLRKVTIFMEKFWLALAIISLIVVIYIFITSKGITRENLSYLVFPLLAAMMYGFRKFFRKRMEKMDNIDSK